MRRSFLMIALGVLFLTSATWRLQRVDDGVIIKNIDASYHMLLTATAYSRVPIATHKLLPLFNLGAPEDHSFDRGSALPDGKGNIYYLSFPALGFIVPWVFFSIFHLTPTLTTLTLFNLLLHGCATVLMCFLVWNLVERFREAITLLAGASYLFAIEALYAHGTIYWHHSLFQVVWLGQLVWLHRLLSERTARVWPLVVLCFVGPLIEWSGYLANIAFAGAVYFAREKRCLRLPLTLLAVTALAALITVANVAAVVTDLEGAGLTMLSRAGERGWQLSISGLWYQLSTLMHGYMISFGWLTILSIMAGIIIVWRCADKPSVVLLIVATIPAIENLIMLNHAIIYSFARLKVLIPITLLLALAASLMSRRVAAGFAALWFVAIAGNAYAYARHPREIPDAEVRARNLAILEEVRTNTPPCMIWASTTAVRGAALLLARRGIAEHVRDNDDLIRVVVRHNACGGVLLHDPRTRGDVSIPAWRGYSVLAVLPNTPFPITDENWDRGIMRQQSALVIRTSEADSKALQPGRYVTLAHSGRRKIIHIDRSATWTNVFVEGALLDPKRDGYPNSFAIE